MRLTTEHVCGFYYASQPNLHKAYRSFIQDLESPPKTPNNPLSMIVLSARESLIYREKLEDLRRIKSIEQFVSASRRYLVRYPLDGDDWTLPWMAR